MTLSYVAKTSASELSAYTIGGYKDDGDYGIVAMRDVEQIKGNDFETTARGNYSGSAVAFAGAVALDTDADGEPNYIFLLGGEDENAGTTSFNEVWRFTPLDTWSSMTSMGYRRGRHAVAELDDKAHYFGGNDESDTLHDDIANYDPGSDSHTTPAGSPTIDDDTEYLTAVTMPGSPDLILIAGGDTSSVDWAITTHQSYDSTGPTVSSLTAIPEARAKHSAVVGNDGSTDNEYLFCGENNSDVLVTDVKKWKSSAWSSETTFPATPRESAGISMIGNFAVISGGKKRDTGDRWLRSIYKYDVVNQAWSQAPDKLPSDSRYGHAQASM